MPVSIEITSCRYYCTSILYNTGSLYQNFERTIVIVSLSISLSMCFGYSKEPSHGDGSFEYPQHMFILRNNNNNFLLRILSGGLPYSVYRIVPVFIGSSHCPNLIANTRNNIRHMD